MSNAAIPMFWDGEALRPLVKFAKQADQTFVIGEVYAMAEVQERSSASHRHYFGCVAQAWHNLPEAMSERFPSAEHLRKFALIKTGFHDERSIVCATKAEAQRTAAFVKPMDDFAIVLVVECSVVVYTAKSQSERAMGRAAFQASKSAVLGLLADMIGVDPAALSRAEAA